MESVYLQPTLGREFRLFGSALRGIHGKLRRAISLAENLGVHTAMVKKAREQLLNICAKLPSKEGDLVYLQSILIPRQSYYGVA